MYTEIKVISVNQAKIAFNFKDVDYQLIQTTVS